MHGVQPGEHRAARVFARMRVIAGHDLEPLWVRRGIEEGLYARTGHHQVAIGGDVELRPSLQLRERRNDPRLDLRHQIRKSCAVDV